MRPRAATALRFVRPRQFLMAIASPSSFETRLRKQACVNAPQDEGGCENRGDNYTRASPATGRTPSIDFRIASPKFATSKHTVYLLNTSPTLNQFLNDFDPGSKG